MKFLFLRNTEIGGIGTSLTISAGTHGQVTVIKAWISLVYRPEDRE